jgi:hypothetical protein
MCKPNNCLEKNAPQSSAVAQTSTIQRHHSAAPFPPAKTQHFNVCFTFISKGLARLRQTRGVQPNPQHCPEPQTVQVQRIAFSTQQRQPAITPQLCRNDIGQWAATSATCSITPMHAVTGTARSDCYTCHANARGTNKLHCLHGSRAAECTAAQGRH